MLEQADVAQGIAVDRDEIAISTGSDRADIELPLRADIEKAGTEGNADADSGDEQGQCPSQTLLDSARTQVVMESLLNAIVETGAGIAIIDITGVPTVDTLVAQHLLKTVAAARLMGADCILSGIRPQIAQTIVHLGVELGDVITKATLADAFSLALQRGGMGVVRTNGRA